MTAVSLYRSFGKRGLDVGLSLAGLAFFALPMIWMGWRVRRESGGPVFFRQLRLGYQGHPFYLLKFRSMTPQGEVTPFGERLRAAAMDELPQLLNILKGEMSFVGPRPLIPSELEELMQFPGGKRRWDMRPGLTGLAQIHAAKRPPPFLNGWGGICSTLAGAGLRPIFASSFDPSG